MTKCLVSIMRRLFEFFGNYVFRVEYLFEKVELMYEKMYYCLSNIFEMELKVSLSIFIHNPFIVDLIEYGANSSYQSLLDLIVCCYLVYVLLREVSVEVLEVYYSVFYVE